MKPEWIQSLLGGALIGLSVTLMLLFNGRVTGISGILQATLTKPSAEHFWRYAFLLGLILGGGVLTFAHPESLHSTVETSTLKLILAGLLVGFGTTLGSGCTSGHGVCGISRLSLRSIVATLVFITMGILTVRLL